MSFIFGGDDDAADAQIQAAERSSDAQIQAQREALAAGDKAFEEAKGFIKPLFNEKSTAIDRARALSGALGPEAQEKAIADFRESPQTEFLRERGERSINNRAAATGGLGGGNRLKALSEFNQNIALGQFQNTLNNLQGIGNIDLGIGTSLANLRTGRGAAEIRAAENIGNAQANQFTQRGNIQAEERRNQANSVTSGLVGLGTSLATGNPLGLLGGL